MKTICLTLIFMLAITMSSAQKHVEMPLINKGQCFMYFYPSSLIAGDLAFGMEYVFANKISHEISMNVKLFQTNFYEYNNGVRFDYQFRYFFYNKKRLAISANLAFAYKNIYFENKQISYYYNSEPSYQPYQLYEIILEDRRQEEFGIGLGMSLSYKVYKRFFMGADMNMYFSKYTLTSSYKERLYRDPNSLVTSQFDVPSITIVENSSPNVTLLFRLKMSVLFSTRKK